MTNTKISKLLASAASAFKHGRLSTANKKLQEVLGAHLGTKHIRIFMEGSVVHGVKDIPQDVIVYIYDYDVEDLEPRERDKDANGKDCYIRSYNSNHNRPPSETY